MEVVMFNKFSKLLMIFAVIISLTGLLKTETHADNHCGDCGQSACGPNGPIEPASVVADPLKYFNWGMYYINDGLHTVIVNPVQVVISYILPRFLRRGINNAVNNIVTPISMVNNLFQFKFKNSGTETLRFVSNSTIGLLGLIEVAEPLFGLEPKSEDFGQTFGYWGIHEGFYLNLPLLGATTLRDFPGALVTDSYDAIETHRGKEIGPMRYSKGWFGTSFISGSLMLGQYEKAKSLAKEKDIPPYIFLRDAWVQQRHLKVIDKKSDNFSNK
jgi:phospholipid-binding lipoprotein MlaA